MRTKTLKFGDVTRDSDIRELDEMRDLLMDTDFARTAENRPLYYMYRDLYKAEHEDAIRDHNLRFDITVIPAKQLGREYVKTKGHYHPATDHGIAYPEIYEVMEGTAHYLLQKKGADGSLDDVVLVKASTGDKVIIPPGYGHITINPGSRPLKMANWVSTKFESQYEDIEENNGGAYYETITDEFVENPKYDSVPDLRFAEPQPVPDLNIEPDTPMYTLIESPHQLGFLNRPHKFQWVFDNLY